MQKEKERDRQKHTILKEKARYEEKISSKSIDFRMRNGSVKDISHDNG